MAEETNASGMRVDIDLVRQLAHLLDETKLTEIEVEDGGRRIRVAREIATTVAAAPMMAAAAAAAPAPAAAAPVPVPALNAVKSPMVGTVYLTPEPGARQFV